MIPAPDEIWLGQGRRKRAMDVISRLAKENCPMSYKKLASIISYQTGLSRRKITDDYLVVLLDVGILENKQGILSIVDHENVDGE